MEVFEYLYAILHSSEYRSKYAELLRFEFPSIPPDPPRELVEELCALGRELIETHLHDPPLRAKTKASYVGDATPFVETVAFDSQTIWLNRQRTAGFTGVSAEMWQFEVGGYRVCDKWLKARRGETLARADVEHFEVVLTALRETLRLVTAVDSVIGTHGGWPTAFASPRPRAAAV